MLPRGGATQRGISIWLRSDIYPRSPCGSATSSQPSPARGTALDGSLYGSFVGRWQFFGSTVSASDKLTNTTNK